MERMLYFFDYVHRNASEILAIVESRPSGVFQSSTDAALEKTRQFRSRLHVEFAGFEISREIEIELGRPHDAVGREVKIDRDKQLSWGESVFIPVKWHSKSGAGLFPVMDAELEITQLGNEPPLTEITLKGFYRPPIGVLGTAGDAMLMHRVAEASVRNFVSELAVRLKRA